jgi:hypothetical protein
VARLLAVSSQLAAGSASDLRRSFGELSLVEDVGREKETVEMAYESTPGEYFLGCLPFGTDRGHFARVNGAWADTARRSVALDFEVAGIGALHERRAHLHLGSEQMLPSLPSGVPDLMQDSRINPELNFPADVAVKSAVRIEVKFAQWRMEAPLVPLWQKRNDAPGEKCLCVARPNARNQQRAEPTIGEERRRFGIFEQCVAAGAQPRVAQNVECTR